MKKLLALSIIALSFVSCMSDDINPSSPVYVRPDRHDLPPVNFKGDWASISNKEAITVTLTDSTITLNLTEYGRGVQTINFKPLYTANVSNRSFRIENEEGYISLSNGIGEYEKYLTLTINNDCITRMAVFVPKPETNEPTQPEQPTTPVTVN